MTPTDADQQPGEAEQQGQRRGGGRPPGGGREAGTNRDSGGLRIRLSENEQRAAKVVQEAFQLRSTIAALGFSIRTVAQLLEQGALDALVAEMRAQAGSRPERSRPEGGRSEGGRSEGGRSGEGNAIRRGRRDGAGEGRSEGRSEGRGERRVISRPDPFARPSRPELVREPEPVAQPSEAAEEPTPAGDAMNDTTPAPDTETQP
ncbi:hypothetical protein KBY97_02505 [Synechococcus sp. ATX 2A4]|nr:hypothetical protein [Synechococcus sp. ATX 2A4]